MVTTSAGDLSVIVCDNGSYSVKVGYNHNELPRLVMPTLIGTPRKEMSIIGYGHRNRYVGDTVVENRGTLDISRPINNGIITDWEAMEDFWEIMYYDLLMTPPEDHGILHTEPADNPPENRAKLIELMFELFNVPSTILMTTSTLALHASGFTTGLVVDSGFDETRVIPVYEGFAFRRTQRMPVGGRHVTDYMMRMLTDRGIEMTMSKHRDLARKIKEEQCYSALDFEKELAESDRSGIEYHLPDGNPFRVRQEVFRAPEILFNPGLLDIESKLGGLGDVIIKTIKSCSADEWKYMYHNVVLAGGNTLFPRLQTRLESMIKSKIIAKPGRQYASWIGGSVVASSLNFQQNQLITKSEFAEHGTEIVLAKCYQ